MKKFTTLALLAGLVVSGFTGVQQAKAAEFKPLLEFVEEFYYGEAGHKLPNDNFGAYSRIRFGFDYAASEDLSATMLFEYGAHAWGNNGDDFTADPSVDHEAFVMRLAYIDWTVPGTDVLVRMGRQGVVTPSYAFGSPILDDRADGITFASNVTDNILVTATWMRLASGNGYSGMNGSDPVYDKNGFRAFDDADALMLTSEFAYDSFKIAPWAMYVNVQKGVGEHFVADPAHDNGYMLKGDTKAWALGLSAELTLFDPFTFAVDTMYNNIKISPIDPTAEDRFDSFYVGASASYALDNGTLALKGWYTTGNDNDAKNDNGFIALGGGFGATSIMFDDNEIAEDPFTRGEGSPMGTLGVIFEYADFSFLDKLTHTARIAYIQGTNEAEFVGGVRQVDGDSFFDNFTDEDSAVEIDFNSTYEIYKNLSATVELGYLFVDMGKLSQDAKNSGIDDNIFRSTLRFVYNF